MMQQQQQQTDLSSLGLLQEGQSQTLATGAGAGSGAQGMTLAARRSLYQHHQAQQRELSQQQARASGSGGPVIDLNQSPPLNPQASARPPSTYQFAFGVPHPAPRVASSSSPSSSPQSSQLSNSPNVASGGPDSGSMSGSDYGGYTHGAGDYASVDLSRSSSSDSIPAMSLGGGPTTTAGAHPYHRQNPLLSLRMAYKPAGSDGMPSPVLGPTHSATAGGKRSMSDVESQSGAEDDDAPVTPKGHPLGSAASGFYDSVLRSVAHQTVQNVVNSVTNNSADNVQHAPGFEPARSFFSGFLGGGGTGIKKGMRGSEGDHRGRSMKRYGKFYKPQPSGSSVVMAPGVGGARTGDRRQSWHSTLSYLTRIPRKVRPLLLGTLIFLLTGLVMFIYANERVAGAERAAARRHVAHLQRAYIRKDWDGGMAAQHPMPHLRAQDGAVAADGHRHASDDVVLETDLAANYEGENEQQDDLIAENSIVDTLILTPRDELVGLISFLTSTSASALPRIDPSKPLDPQLILDFDHTKPTARQDMRQLESDMMALFPVILFGRMRDPHHREMMKMLSQYKIDPPPLIVEVDQRADAETLIPLLARLLGSPQLPQLVLGGTAAGSYKEAQKALDDKTFKQWIARSGADITEKKIKKKPKYAKMAERAENERVLGPRPIGGA